MLPSCVVWTLCILACSVVINFPVIITSPMAVASPAGSSNQFSWSFLSRFNSTLGACSCLILIMWYTYSYALNRKGLKTGSVYPLNKGYALNDGERLTTRVHGMAHVTGLIKYKNNACCHGNNTSGNFAWVHFEVFGQLWTLETSWMSFRTPLGSKWMYETVV